MNVGDKVRGIVREVTIGPCRLILGDCIEVIPTLDRGSITAIVTSPPYNQMSSIPETASGLWGGDGFVRAWKESGYEDEMEELEYQASQNEIFKQLLPVAGPKCSLFYNHQIRWRNGAILHPVQWFRPEGWVLRQEIIWDRGGGMMHNAKMFCRFDERILWMDKGQHKWNQDSTGMGTIWRVARMQQQQGKIHPVQFPDEIPMRCIESTTDPMDIILDPFMGSATSGVACIDRNTSTLLLNVSAARGN